jgi:hypothetical protein
MKHAVLARGRPPLNVIRMEENLQVRYWMQRLLVSRQALDLAVQAVGNDAAEVERFVLRAKGRCAGDARHQALAFSASADEHGDGRAG